LDKISALLSTFTKFSSDFPTLIKAFLNCFSLNTSLFCFQLFLIHAKLIPFYFACKGQKSHSDLYFFLTRYSAEKKFWLCSLFFEVLVANFELEKWRRMRPKEKESSNSHGKQNYLATFWQDKAFKNFPLLFWKLTRKASSLVNEMTPEKSSPQHSWMISFDKR